MLRRAAVNYHAVLALTVGKNAGIGACAFIGMLREKPQPFPREERGACFFYAVSAHAGDEVHLRAEPVRGHGLVAALAAGLGVQRVRMQRLAAAVEMLDVHKNRVPA